MLKNAFILRCDMKYMEKYVYVYAHEGKHCSCEKITLTKKSNVWLSHV